MLTLRRLLFLLLVCTVAAAAWQPGDTAANDWPGWRGADRTGVSAETGLLTSWPEGGPPVAWKATDLGTGYSTPAVAAGRIYLMGARDKKEHLIVLDAKDGKEVWTAPVGAIGPSGPPSYPGPHSTPMIDGDHVYTLGSDGDLVCFTTQGKEVWRKNLTKDLGGERGRWSYSESPLLDGEALVCTPGGPKATLAAMNKKTGEVIWKAATGAKGTTAAYASVVKAEAGGVKQYVQFLAGCLIGVSAKDGKLLWRYDKVTSITNCSTPIVHDGHVFVSAAAGGRGGKGGKGGGGGGGKGGGKMGGGGGGALLKLGADDATEVYRVGTLGNHHGGVVRVGDCLYGTNNAGLLCIDFKTGETKWENPSVGKGSVTAADGRLYVRGERGKIALVEVSPAGYKETGRFEPTDLSGKQTWPYPVVSGGKLYVRDQGVLLCYDVKQK